MDHSQAFSLASLWNQTDAVGKGVTVLLISLSISSWYVIVTKIVQIARMRALSRNAESSFWDASNFNDALASLGSARDNPYYAVAARTRDAAEHHSQRHGALHDSIRLDDWLASSLRLSIDEAIARMSGGMSMLASIAGSAPFVGLFGTVWGVYHALVAMGGSGAQTIDKVAGPVGEALIMTALGLAVAIPAGFAYNAFVRANKATAGRLNRFGFDLHSYFVTGARLAPTVAAGNRERASLAVIPAAAGRA
ncbi:MotA/TolQ/ExbB proton channel family protein [Derxia gummosa]|uniref:Biopolymer transport protein ExbB n=1 Tax=Derxia gummosa DSM 723 TaxID=1121388 RepID=A0A8B6X758_9BURK|nr:MotA/TolQ/ExbB proton channel family protein [Derxia gummosa]